MIKPNKKTVRELLTELEPDKHLVMYDPNRPDKIIAQCVRVGEYVYYLTGPQFNHFTAMLHHPAFPDIWELNGLFEAARDDNTTEPEMVDLMNGFLRDHGAPPEALVFTCTTLPDVIDTLAGLFASYSIKS